MTLIKLNDGESITVQMNHDKSKLPYSVLIMRRGKFMSLREFGDSKEGIFEASIKKKGCGEYIETADTGCIINCGDFNPPRLCDKCSISTKGVKENE